jgi:hypothetical protein
MKIDYRAVPLVGDPFFDGECRPLRFAWQAFRTNSSPRGHYAQASIVLLLVGLAGLSICRRSPR